MTGHLQPRRELSAEPDYRGILTSDFQPMDLWMYGKDKGAQGCFL